MCSTPVDLRCSPSVSLAQPHSFQLHLPFIVLCCCSAAKLCPTLSPYGLQHTRFLCPSLSPRVCSNSHPLNWWCYLTIPSSAALFSFCLQSFPASGPFPMGQFSVVFIWPCNSTPRYKPKWIEDICHTEKILRKINYQNSKRNKKYVGPISSKESDLISKIYPTKKTLGPDPFTFEFYQTFKK